MAFLSTIKILQKKDILMSFFKCAFLKWFKIKDKMELIIVFIPYPPRKYCVSSTVRLVLKALFHIVNSSNAVFGRMWSSGSPFRTRQPIEMKGTYNNDFN